MFIYEILYFLAWIQVHSYQHYSVSLKVDLCFIFESQMARYVFTDASRSTNLLAQSVKQELA